MNQEKKWASFLFAALNIHRVHIVHKVHKVHNKKMEAKQRAIFIINTLRKKGYLAYFAGGWVRDFLMEHPSDDIDIATDASPEAIMQLFPHTAPVGAAFGVVIVIIDGHPFEVASFRKDLDYVGGRRPGRIELSTPKEDAYRRDFTINGMFFDPIDETIHDYVEGKQDLELGLIRTIGDPHERFEEDRLRMIRAIRFASRFGFDIHETTQEAIKAYAHTLLPSVAMERIWQEFTKMSKAPRFDKAIVEMHRLGLLPTIFPNLRNVPLEDIEERVVHFNRFPKGTPAILYLTELFPETSLEELLEVCQYLKTSVEEGKMVEFSYRAKMLLGSFEGLNDAELAYFYADRLFSTCFDVVIVRHPELLRETHKQHRERLLPHIQRIVDKKPIVTASILKDHGVKPGKIMGALLKEAEKIAILHNFSDSDQVMKLLKQTSLWRENEKNL